MPPGRVPKRLFTRSGGTLFFINTKIRLNYAQLLFRLDEVPATRENGVSEGLDGLNLAPQLVFWGLHRPCRLDQSSGPGGVVG